MITPEYIQARADKNKPATPAGVDSAPMILERLKLHKDQENKEIMYGMRMVVANFLDLSSETAPRNLPGTDGKFVDVVNKRWEEGRHNHIQNNTLIQVKSLVFSDPDITWSGCTGKHPDLVSDSRKAYYVKNWRDNDWSILYRQKLLDIITSGMGNVQVGVRDGAPFMEYLDSLFVTWDTSYKEPKKKRFVFVDKPMPTSDALRFFPELAGKIKMPRADGTGGENIVMITFYWSKTTAAVFYKQEMIEGPRANPYGKIPVILTTFIQHLSMKHPSGMVETQIGAHRLAIRLQRYYREVVAKGTPVGVLAGPGWRDEDIDTIVEGTEGNIIRNVNSAASYKVVAGAEIQGSALKLDEMNQQHINAASGVNDFQRSQTDTKVDFASQLAYIAQESGIQGQFTAQVHEEGIKEDARLFLEVASRFEEGPLTLSIRGQDMVFDQFMPIRPLLGTDGAIDIKPMAYESSAQKLQKTMILANVLHLGDGLPPPLQDMIWEQALTHGGVDNKDEIMQQLRDMRQQQQAASQQPPQGPQQGGMPPQGAVDPQALIAQAQAQASQAQPQAA